MNSEQFLASQVVDDWTEKTHSPDDEGRAIPRNVVVEKHRDDG
jgi:hypothetical protein